MPNTPSPNLASSAFGDARAGVMSSEPFNSTKSESMPARRRYRRPGDAGAAGKRLDGLIPPVAFPGEQPRQYGGTRALTTTVISLVFDRSKWDGDKGWRGNGFA